MSFILDALKKSENERQRKIGPSLADVQSRARPSEKPWWALAVGGLLLVNLAVLLIVLLRNGEAEPPRQALEPAVEAERQPASPRTTSIAATAAPARPVERSISLPPGNPAVRSLADEAEAGMLEPFPYENPNLAGAANVPDRSPIVRPIQPPAVAPSRVAPTYEQPPAEPTEVLPTLRDLAAGGTQLPDLHLDIHVHSPHAAERFVFVNMRKYIEGQALNEGPAVERITPDGVVLNHRGMRFLLPRQ